MSTTEDDVDPSEECRLAVDAVLDVAAEHCESEQVVRDRIAKMLGVEPDVDCGAALDEGLDRATCQSSKGLKQWVACRAQDLRREEDLGLGTAMEEAWDEAKEQCLTRGIDV